MKPDISLEQAQAVVETKTMPRVTKEHIEGKIAAVDYLTQDILTISIITMVNGFRVVGKSAPASPENYDLQVGQRYAYEDAFKQLWQFEGYLLCDNLHSAARGA